MMNKLWDICFITSHRGSLSSILSRVSSDFVLINRSKRVLLSEDQKFIPYQRLDEKPLVWKLVQIQGQTMLAEQQIELPSVWVIAHASLNRWNRVYDFDADAS